MAAASASELEYELILAHDLQVVKAADHERLPAHTIEVKRMLAALIRTPRAES
jgi:four helix bundle protein